MQKKNYIIYFFILSVFSSCVNNEKSEKGVNFNKKYTLKLLANKTIYLDSLTAPYQTHYFFYEDKKEADLFILNKLDNSLQRYDWEKGVLKSRKKLQKIGPNGIGSGGQIFVKNLDSIFVISGFDFKLYLLDNEYNVKKRFSIMSSDISKPTLGFGMFASGNLGFWKDKIIFGGYPFMDREDRRFYDGGFTSGSVNIKTENLSFLTKSPPSYLSKFNSSELILPPQIESKITFNYKLDQLIVSYKTDPLIEVYDLLNNKSKYYYAGSTQIEDIEWINKKSTKNRKKEAEYLKNSSIFSAITYDQYRQVYYRIFEKPNPLKVDEYDNRPWTLPSIIILNKNFEKIGETVLPKLGYSLSNILITKKGPYIRKYVPEEDKMVFTLFELSKL